MTMREKLARLLYEFHIETNNHICDGCGSVSAEDVCEEIAEHLISNGVTVTQDVTQSAVKWIPVDERLPKNFVSVLGYMTDAGDFPPVRECYTVGNAFFFPALSDVHPVSHWMEMPEAPKEVD